jgi:hypothetical protein
MIERLQPGSLHGHVKKSLRVADFILTETTFDSHLEIGTACS